jgi:hypothetical protein
MVARDLILAAASAPGCTSRTCRPPAPSSSSAQAKARGTRVTAEATPHHFTLTDDLVATYDAVYKVNPPLRTKADVEAVRAGLADGTIDAIATDHAPHAPEHKEQEWGHAPCGMLGLETALAVTLTELVDAEDEARRLTLARRRRAVDQPGAQPRHRGARRADRAEGAPANLVVFDPSSAGRSTRGAGSRAAATPRSPGPRAARQGRPHDAARPVHRPRRGAGGKRLQRQREDRTDDDRGGRTPPRRCSSSRTAPPSAARGSARRHRRRRGRVQHRDDRLPGGPHRPELPPPARRDDLPAPGQLRDRAGGRRGRRRAGRRVHRPRGQPHATPTTARSAAWTTCSPTSGVVGITEVDTRRLTRHIRDAGALRGVISTEVLDVDELLEQARSAPQMEGAELTSDVTGRALRARPRG